MTNFQSIEQLIKICPLPALEKERLLMLLKKLSEEELSSLVDILEKNPEKIYKLLDTVQLWHRYIRI